MKDLQKKINAATVIRCEQVLVGCEKIEHATSGVIAYLDENKNNKQCRVSDLV